jgi:alkylation response protein AidB-like acyl-CoA dehydrogenase
VEYGKAVYQVKDIVGGRNVDFRLSKKQKMIKDMTRKFAREVVAPRAPEYERTGEHPYDIVEQMGTLGMMGIPFPKKYGGGNGDWISMYLCLEELSRVDVLPAVILSVSAIGVGQELLAFGTEWQKQRWLTPIAQGKELGASALTEPDAGSDAGSIKTTAVLEGDEWIINGTKQFITTSNGKEIICTIIVPTDTPGFQVGKKHEKMGERAVATHELFFDDCRVPKDYLLGGVDKGFSQRLSSLQTGRIAIGAIATGFAQACFDEALTFYRQKYSGHHTLFTSQRDPFKLADMAMRIELCRTMYLKAGWLKDQGETRILEASYTKLYIAETATNIATEVLRMCSPYGYLDRYPISRYFRVAKLHEIVEGTTEMQKLIIARELLGLRKDARRGDE